MIKTNVLQEPIYECVQIGSKDVINYETTDGRIFYDQENAKKHQDEIDAEEFTKTNMRSYQVKPTFRSNHGCWYRLNSYRDLYLAYLSDRDYSDDYEICIDGNFVGKLDELLEHEQKLTPNWYILTPNWYLLTVRYNSSNDWVVAVYLTSKERVVEQLEASINSFKSQIPK